jgi:hypothetical protein
MNMAFDGWYGSKLTVDSVPPGLHIRVPRAAVGDCPLLNVERLRPSATAALAYRKVRRIERARG